MRVETLEYGDDPESEYPEDWNSFKVFTVWSQPGAKDSTINDKGLRTEEVKEKDKRLATVVELPRYKGGFIFIEKPSPGPDWIEKIFKILKEKGWEGKPFKDFRVTYSPT